MLKRMKAWLEWRGIKIKDLVMITFAFSSLGAVIFFGVLSLFY